VTGNGPMVVWWTVNLTVTHQHQLPGGLASMRSMPVTVTAAPQLCFVLSLLLYFWLHRPRSCCAGVLLIAAVAALLLWRRRKRRHQQLAALLPAGKGAAFITEGSTRRPLSDIEAAGDQGPQPSPKTQSRCCCCLWVV
jgi:hypothetical protein